MKSIIEIRKENEKYEKIYEGNNNNYLINNLIKNTNYELRICSIYNNDLISLWSDIQKIKTLNFECDSNILKESKRENELLNKLYEWSGGKKLELLFRGTRDGMTCKDFHNKCDNKGPTITLIKNDKGFIFGGYSSISWINDNNDTFHSAPDSFLFTLTNIHNTQPTKFPSKNDNYEIKHNSGYGPTFGGGHDLGTYSNFTNDGGWTNIG